MKRLLIVLTLLSSSCLAEDSYCNGKAKLGQWKTGTMGRADKPIENLFMHVDLPLKKLAWTLDRLPVMTKQSEISKKIGEKPHKEIKLFPGTGQTNWILKSNGENYGLTIYFYKDCISKISLLNINKFIFIDRDNILSTTP